MKQYICVECQAVYDDTNKPDDFVCKKQECPGEGMTGLVIEKEASTPHAVGEKEVGICILLMDASGSMFYDHAFEGYEFPSTFGEEFLKKAEIVAKCAAKAIFELKRITLRENQEAYIMAIKFDHRQSVMFHKSIRDIIKEFEDPNKFARYIFDELSEMKGGTNINDALEMAYSFVSKFKEGNVPGIGKFKPMHDSVYLPNKEDGYKIPNIRAMVYTDGEQHGKHGPLKNPFNAHDPDLLIGAFIGDRSEAGCKNLQNIVSKCPVHQNDQFFVIDNPQSQATLRKLFRMASDASGFCPSCIESSQLR